VELYHYSSYKPLWLGNEQLYVVQQVTEICPVCTTAVVSPLQIGNNRPISTAEAVLLYSKLNMFMDLRKDFFYLLRKFCQLLLACLIDLHWVRAFKVPMHLGLIDGPFVTHNLIAQESPVPLPKFQMAPRLKILMSSRSKKGTQIYYPFLSRVPAS
jgi:hypothetical protein